MTEPAQMPTDAVAWPLHLKAALGQQLTPEERATLDAWYTGHEREDAAMFASAPPSVEEAQIHADILATLARISALAQQTQKLEEENERLRQEIRQLQARLAQKKTA